MTLVQKEVKAVYIGTTKVRPSWPDKDYLCFTAEEANATIILEKVWNPTSVNLETSTDWQTWSNYTFWDTITLSAIGDKVYWRNKSDTVTKFSTSTSNFYHFKMLNWKVWATGDVNFLLCSDSTDTIPWTYTFYYLFVDCYITSCPKLPATTLQGYCYYDMFKGCPYLVTLPKLPATQLPTYCYYEMFRGCGSIKLSTTQDSNYTQAYRIPTEWTGTTSGSYQTRYMFTLTWWTFTWGPSINTTYYVHKNNTIVE